MTMPGDPSEGSGRQWVGHWYRRGHVTRRGYAIPPGWGEGTAEHTHTRHDDGGATTAYGAAILSGTSATEAVDHSTVDRTER